jgi:biotin transport system substrate-specific component
MKNKLTIRELAHIAIFTAIIAICAQIRFPMPFGVPLTLQTFAIMLAGVVLGMRNGTIAVTVYVLLGIAGAPVFQSFTGGPAVVFGPTGGFVLSFPLMALLAGIGAKRNNNIWLILWLVAAVTLNYICGMAVFGLITGNTLAVLAFIPLDTVKIIMVAVTGKKIRYIMSRFL